MYIAWNADLFRASSVIKKAIWSEVPSGSWYFSEQQESLLLKGKVSSFRINRTGEGQQFPNHKILEVEHLVFPNLVLGGQTTTERFHQGTVVIQDTLGTILMSCASSDYWTNPITGEMYLHHLDTNAVPDDRHREHSVIQLDKLFANTSLVPQ